MENAAESQQRNATLTVRDPRSPMTGSFSKKENGMRPGQQNRRMRGRNNNNNNSNNNNNNRRGPNPLTRNYESNGPDVKIRGSAQQIAEKYTTLARDSQTSGDRVMAENYLQHAEHYNRIIAAAQAQMPIQQVRDNREDSDSDDDQNDEGENSGVNGSQDHSRDQRRQASANDGSGPQPVIEGTPAEVAYKQNSGRDSGQGSEHASESAASRNSPNGAENQGGEPRANGSHSADTEAAPAPRRARRPRRKANAGNEEDGHTNGAVHEGGQAANEASSNAGDNGGAPDSVN